MTRLSLRLPESLHQQLTHEARREGVSLNQYLVFLLARHSAPAYSVLPAVETAAEQQARFEKLRADLGPASAKDVERVLDERAEVAPEEGWTPELRARFERQLARARNPLSS